MISCKMSLWQEGGKGRAHTGLYEPCFPLRIPKIRTRGFDVLQLHLCVIPRILPIQIGVVTLYLRSRHYQMLSRFAEFGKLHWACWLLQLHFVNQGSA